MARDGTIWWWSFFALLMLTPTVNLCAWSGSEGVCLNKILLFFIFAYVWIKITSLQFIWSGEKKEYMSEQQAQASSTYFMGSSAVLYFQTFIDCFDVCKQTGSSRRTAYLSRFPVRHFEQCFFNGSRGVFVVCFSLLFCYFWRRMAYTSRLPVRHFQQCFFYGSRGVFVVWFSLLLCYFWCIP